MKWSNEPSIETIKILAIELVGTNIVIWIQLPTSGFES